MNFNKTILIGNLTADPIRKEAQSGAVAEFHIGVNELWQDRGGQQREDRLFIGCAAFGHAANSILKHCCKGDLVLVEGKLRLENWTEPDGAKHSRHSIIVQSYRLLTPKMNREP